MIVFLLLAIASDARASDARYVYWVDVRRAMLGMSEGKVVAAELDAERARTDAELSALETALAEMQRGVRAQPTKMKRAEYEKKAAELEAAQLAAEARLEELETKRIQPVAEDVRGVIAGLNEATPHIRLLEIDRHAPLNFPPECNATEWLLMRLERPGKKPLARHNSCSIKFFLYVDVAKLKLEMKATAPLLQVMEAVREERLAEIEPAVSSTSTPLTRFERFLRYSELERVRRERELKNDAAMTAAATEFVRRTATPMKGVLFLGAGGGDGARLRPSCDVTSWLIRLENGAAVMEDVAHDCKCVWLNRQGTRVRVAQGCGG